MATSNRGYHLVQIVDVMVDVRKMAQRKTRNKMQGVDAKKGKKKYLQETEQKSKLRGILGGALLTTSEDDEDNFYFGAKKKTNLTNKMETMGCQILQITYKISFVGNIIKDTSPLRNQSMKCACIVILKMHQWMEVNLIHLSRQSCFMQSPFFQQIKTQEKQK